MWEVEDIKEACDRIERNTVYNAFKYCQQFFSSIMAKEDLIELYTLFECKKLTWNAMSKAWDAAFSGRSLSSEENELQKILKDRAKKGDA